MSTTVEADRKAVGDKYREAERSALGVQVELGRMIEALLDKAGNVARAAAKDGTRDKACSEARADQRKLLASEEGMSKQATSDARRFVVLLNVSADFAKLTLGAAQRLAKLAVLSRETDTYSVPQTQEQPWQELLPVAIAEVLEQRNQVKAAQERADLITDPVAEVEAPAPTPAPEPTSTPQAQPAGDGDPDLEDEGEEQGADEELPPSYANLPANSAARTAAEILRVSEDRAAAYRGLGQITEGDDVAQVVRGFADWLESEHIVDATPRWHALVRQIAEQGARLVANHVIEKIDPPKRVERPKQVA